MQDHTMVLTEVSLSERGCALLDVEAARTGLSMLYAPSGAWGEGGLDGVARVEQRRSGNHHRRRPKAPSRRTLLAVDRERTLTAAVIEDGEWFVARCLEVEVASQGTTIDDALANLREALELYFEDDEVPASFTHPLITPIEIRISA